MAQNTKESGNLANPMELENVTTQISQCTKESGTTEICMEKVYVQPLVLPSKPIFYILNIGIKTFPDGTVFEGMYEKGKCNGKGTKQLANGTAYNGTWQDGIMVEGY